MSGLGEAKSFIVRVQRPNYATGDRLNGNLHKKYEILRFYNALPTLLKMDHQVSKNTSTFSLDYVFMQAENAPREFLEN